MAGPATAVTSSGTAAFGTVASAPWAAAQYSAASTGHQGVVPAFHATHTHCGSLGPGGAAPHAHHPAQTQQPGAALWSTIPPLPNQSVGLASSAVAPIPPDAARAALFMSQLSAMQAAPQAAVLPPLTIPPPAYVAPRTEGASARHIDPLPRQQHSPVTISGYRTRRRPSARIRLTRTFGRPKRALSAMSPTRMRPMIARPASLAYLGRRCLGGLGTGKRMRRHGLATVLPCYSLRTRRSQSI